MITIIVLLILAGTSIAMLTGDSGILTQAQRAKLSTELAGYKEELDLYKLQKQAEDSNFLDGSLTAGKTNLSYNTKPESETGNIKTVITNISDEYFEKLEIIKGELLINTKDKAEIKVAQSLGIAVNPYDITDEGELLSSYGNLLLMDDNGTVTIPDSVTKIGEGAFANLEGLKTIIIPGSVKKIAKNAFSYNTTLENVIMQEGVETIGDSAFRECSNLKNVQMPESISNIEQLAFASCRNLEEIEIPSKITTINYATFSGCNKLSKITFRGDALTSIGGEAFFTTSISKFIITKNINSIAATAFSNCKELIEIETNQNNKYIYENGMLITSDRKNMLFISEKYYKNTDEFSIPDGIIDFSVNIENLTNIKTLKIPETVQNIDVRSIPISIEKVEIDSNNRTYKVEENCIYSLDNEELVFCFSKETNIKLNTPAKKIGEYSFRAAKNATEITLADATEEIGMQPFLDLTNLKKINIGKNVSKISHLVLCGAYGKEINIDNENPNFIVENGFLYSKNKETLVATLKYISGEVTIDINVKELGNGCFAYQGGITRVWLNDKIETIGDSAFHQCTNLTEIEIPSSIKNISKYSFNECNNLNKIIIHKPENSISGAPWGAPKGMKVVEWSN